jgi:hypothetical protein
MRLGTEGPWTDYTCPPYTDYHIHFALDHCGRVPPPHISFDNGKGRDKTYSLKFYELDSATSTNGKPYKFEYNDGTGWDLFTAD